jgi:hypothetical protein
VAFPESKNRNKQMLDAILAAAMMIEYFEKLLVKLDEVTSTIAELHDAAHPLTSQ